MSLMSATGRLPGRMPEVARRRGFGASASTVRRLDSTRWRDPRLAVGIVLMAASLLLGVRVIGAADDTVAVWSLRDDASAGTPLSLAELTVRRVHFDSRDEVNVYLSADSTPPPGVVLDHDVSGGELLAVSALRAPSDTSAAELPLAVAGGALPADLAAGDRVDVWVTPDPSGTESLAEAVLLLSGVAVVSLDTETALGGADGARVLIALDDAAVSGLDATLAQLSTGRVVLVRRSD